MPLVALDIDDQLLADLFPRSTKIRLSGSSRRRPMAKGNYLASPFGMATTITLWRPPGKCSGRCTASLDNRRPAASCSRSGARRGSSTPGQDDAGRTHRSPLLRAGRGGSCRPLSRSGPGDSTQGSACRCWGCLSVFREEGLEVVRSATRIPRVAESQVNGCILRHIRRTSGPRFRVDQQQ